MVARAVSARAHAGARRYEWSEAGALLHIDAFAIPKFSVPGHWATADRAKRSAKAAKTVVIGVIDDHSRLAYCELHSAESAANVSITLRRGGQVVLGARLRARSGSHVRQCQVLLHELCLP
jgi:hypothetical protein